MRNVWFYFICHDLHYILINFGLFSNKWTNSFKQICRRKLSVVFGKAMEWWVVRCREVYVHTVFHKILWWTKSKEHSKSPHSFSNKSTQVFVNMFSLFQERHNIFFIRGFLNQFLISKNKCIWILKLWEIIIFKLKYWLNCL